MRAKKPSKLNLIEFETYWEEFGYVHRIGKGESETEAKRRLLAWHTYLWQSAGCPRRFYPEPGPDPGPRGSTEMEQDVARDGGASYESNLDRQSQDLTPGKDWNLP